MATTTKPNSTQLTSSQRILLETACVDMIGQVEQLMEKARDEQSAGFLGESMLVGSSILKLLVNFSDGYLSDRTLVLVNDRIELAHQAIKNGTELSQSQTFGSLRRLIGRKSATDVEVARAHTEVGIALAEAVAAAVAGGLHQLKSNSSLVNDLQESIQPILSEMRKTW